MKDNRILILILGVLLIQPGCGKRSVAPGSGKPGFKFEVSFGPGPGSCATSDIPAAGAEGLPKTAAPRTYYNMARVIVSDLSGYHVNNWAEYERTPDGQQYAAARDSWTGNRRSHAAWLGFLGGFFNIIVDQNLTLTEDHAIGTVSGAIGYNQIIVALTDGDLWIYRGEASVIGVEGEVTTVHLYMENVEGWTNL